MSKGLTKTDSLCIKGIGILIMLFHHLYCDTERFEGFAIDFSPFGQDLVVSVSLFCKICVSLFAFITGYGLLKSVSKIDFNRKNVFTWSTDRVIKTMSGFWFIYILAFIVCMIINGRPLEVYFSGSKLRGVLYVVLDFLGLANLFDTPTLNGTWWYMSAALIFIILVPIVYMVTRKIGYLPVIVVIAALPRLLKVGYPGGVNAYSFILVMVFGMMFSEYNVFERISNILPKNKALNYIVPFLVFGAMSALCYLLFRVYPQHEGWEFNFAVVPVIIICFVRYCVIRIPGVKQALCFFGRHSMTIFLTHTFIRYTYLNEFTYSFGSFILIYIVLVADSLALALVIDLVKRLIRFDRLTKAVINKINKVIDKVGVK